MLGPSLSSPPPPQPSQASLWSQTAWVSGGGCVLSAKPGLLLSQFWHPWLQIHPHAAGAGLCPQWMNPSCQPGRALCRACTTLLGLKKSEEVLADLGLFQTHTRQLQTLKGFPLPSRDSPKAQRQGSIQQAWAGDSLNSSFCGQGRKPFPHQECRPYLRQHFLNIEHLPEGTVSGGHLLMKQSPPLWEHPSEPPVPTRGDAGKTMWSLHRALKAPGMSVSPHPSLPSFLL